MSVANAAAVTPVSSRLPRWIGGGTVLAAGLVALTIAVWPASEADQARADGEQVGQAVAQLYDATSAEEVDAALVELHDATAATADHAGDAVAEQVADQEDALARAAEGFAGTVGADDDFEYEVYEYELDVAVDDLATNAEDFRTTGPEVQQAFWEGYDTGLNG